MCRCTRNPGPLLSISFQGENIVVDFDVGLDGVVLDNCSTGPLVAINEPERDTNTVDLAVILIATDYGNADAPLARKIISDLSTSPVSAST